MSYKKGQEPTYLKPEQFRDFDIDIKGKLMPGGETRFSLVTEDGRSVSITKNGDEKHWQKTHHHEVSKEVYIVYSGRICIMRFNEAENSTSQRCMGPGDIEEVMPGEIHTVFMFEGAQFGTQKIPMERMYGSDWFGDSKYDKRLVAPELMYT